MDRILEINNLNYHDFHNFSMSFDKEKFYFVVGPNKSGKTTLFRIISSLILTYNIVNCNNILLNKNNQEMYVKNIGVVERVNKYSFNFHTVLNEMLSPLLNIGYSRYHAIKRIKEVLSTFNLDYLYDKRINELDIYDKQKLLIAISLLHHPRLMIMDNVLEIFSISERSNIIKVLKDYIKNDHLSIINFTVSLDDVLESDKIVLLSNYKVIKECSYDDIYDNDQLFYQNNIEIPFMIDFVIKLRAYNLIEKSYINKKDLVDDLWN